MYSKTREKGGQSGEKIRGGRERRRTVWERWKGRKEGVIKNSKCVVEKIKGRIGAKEENGEEH